MACRVHSAKLIIAKLDRLDRNVAFVSPLMEAGVEFEAVDFPQANRLTIHILAAVAEHEAKTISDRTKAALAAAKRRDVSAWWLPCGRQANCEGSTGRLRSPCGAREQKGGELCRDHSRHSGGRHNVPARHRSGIE